MLGFHQLLRGPPLLGLVSEDEHHARTIFRSSPRIGAPLSAIGNSLPSREMSSGVVSQTDDRTLAQAPCHWILDRLASLLVDDPEHLGQWSAAGLLLGPAGQ